MEQAGNYLSLSILFMLNIWDMAIGSQLYRDHVDGLPQSHHPGYTVRLAFL